MSRPETTRLVTFETAPDEQLVVLAGTSEADRCVQVRGRANGRYAIVPVDDRPASRAVTINLQ